MGDLRRTKRNRQRISQNKTVIGTRKILSVQMGYDENSKYIGDALGVPQKRVGEVR